MDLVVWMVMVLTTLLMDMGLSPTWLQFLQLKDCTDAVEYMYIIKN